MEKIIFFILVIPIMAFVLYLGGMAIMNGFKSKEANRAEEDEEKQPNYVHEEPGDNEYGGFWYRKGYKSQEGLIGFYKKFGFVDEPKVNLEWSCYSEIPFPSMICSL